MAAEVEARQTHHWRRVPWADVSGELGPLVSAQLVRVVGEMAYGTAQAFAVDGPDYRGWCAIRFEVAREGLVARVLAVKGVGIVAWTDHFKAIAKQAGAVSIVANAESAAHVRLYARLGFDVVAADMRMAL